MRHRILTIDDDPFIVQLIQDALEREGYDVSFASSGHEGLQLITNTKPHLVVLDIMMPGIDGLETCSRIREASTVPIIMLTARSTRKDVVIGLEAGADDYLVKPFHPEELLARVAAQLRRLSMRPMEEELPLRFGSGELVIDQVSRQIYVAGERVDLTPKEFDLLSFLAQRAGRVLRTELIFENVWSYDTDANIENVKWYIWRLRNKIEKTSRRPKYIVTERGVGYRFVPHY